MNDSKSNSLDLIDELRAIAQNGLNHSRDQFDLQRYQRIMELVCYEYAAYSGLPTEELKRRFAKELGYVTPKVGVQCALFNDVGEILLEKRSDDALWGLPGGWVEISESPEDAIRRELMEEANLTIDDLSIIGFYTRLPGQFEQPHATVHILYYSGHWDGVVSKSFESLIMQFLDPAKINAWHKDHHRQVVAALKYHGEKRRTIASKA